tara:strand:- start:689 stop:1057 length:369 start_codon:yes stop_codon:yes gene_type:complete
MNKLKVVGWSILLIIIGIIFSQNSVLRKKAARSKAKAEKTKHKARLKTMTEAVTSLDGQIKIANKQKTKNKATLKILKADHTKLKKKIAEDYKKVAVVNSEITSLNSALAYMDRLKKKKEKK